MIPTLAWTPEGVRFIDQTKLPLEESYVLATTYEQVADVIVTMVVRGAPAIGVSAAYGIALGVLHTTAVTPQEFAPEFERICARLAGTRPTAVNLFWAIDRMKRLFAALLEEGDTLAQIQEKILAEAHAMYEEDIAACKTMGAFGGALLPDEGGVLTHCNAGALATCGYGTALGVIGSWFAARSVEAMLFHVSARDPWILAAAVAALWATAMLAAWVPSRRAARVDPMQALRQE